MAKYRVSFCRSSANANEIILLSDEAEFPVWDSVDVVDHLIRQLHGAKPATPLPRPLERSERAREVMQALDAFGIHFLQYVIEDTGVRRTVRQSKERCQFRV